MRILKHFFLNITIIIFCISCESNTGKSSGKISAIEIFNIKNDTIFKFDTTGKSQNERLKRLVAISILKKFDEDRTQFIEADSKEIYKVGDIIRKGNMYQYEVTSDSIEIGIKYMCSPYIGEYQMMAFGEKPLIKLFYDQLRTPIKWDVCNNSNGNESCTATKKIEKYDVDTFFKIDLISLNKDQSEFNYFRKHLIINK